MLIVCPECELQVSDKAMSCPHCGFPLKGEEKRPKNPHKSHKRLPNGFGQITEITSKPLRKPFRVMITVGKNENGRPICKLLKPDSYFKTYNEAYKALVEYNKNPYDLDADLNVSDLYNKWSEKYFESLSNPSSQRTIESAWKWCGPVRKMRVKDIRPRHIKSVMEQQGIKPSIRPRIKSMFNLMLDYALEYEIVEKNYARDFNTDALESKSHISYSNEELDVLWQHVGDSIVNIILIQCYSGWRPAELFNLKFDWDNNIMIGGSKTDAGKDRIVPIHDKILDLCKKEESMLKTLTYDKFFKKYKEIIRQLNLNPNHKPHDGRKTFVTLAKKYNVDEYAIKRIVGHAITDITEKTYTDRDIEWLIDEMSKIDRKVSVGMQVYD